MKAILLLCLIAALNCDLMDTAFCLIENEKIRKTFSQVSDYIKKGNLYKCMTTITSKFNEIKSIVLNCVNKEQILKAQNQEFKAFGECMDIYKKYWTCLFKIQDIIIKDLNNQKNNK